MLTTVVMSVFERHLQTWGIQNYLCTPLVSWLMFWLYYLLSEKITQRSNNQVSLTVVKSSRVSVEEICRNISLKNNYMQIIYKQTNNEAQVCYLKKCSRVLPIFLFQLPFCHCTPDFVKQSIYSKYSSFSKTSSLLFTVGWKTQETFIISIFGFKHYNRHYL